MNKSVFLFFILSFKFLSMDSQQVWAGWTSQTAPANYYQSVHFPTSSVGYAVGYDVSTDGAIVKTTDGGTSWTTITYSLTSANFDIHFPADADTGYFVGNIGSLWRTDNGGSTWTFLFGTSNNLRGAHFPYTRIGYVVGWGGQIHKTTNYGATWSSQSPTTQDLEDVYFINTPIGYTVGDNGTILKTTDGGTNWTAQTSGTTQGLEGVHFPVDTTTGYVVGWAGTILKTTNGGTNWIAQASVTTEDFYSVHFPVDATTGYAVGYNGTIRKTTDGGTNWFAQASGITYPLYSVHFPVNGDIGYAVGQFSILKTEDGGGSQLVLHPTGNGSVNGFTTATGCPSGHWDCVNDQPGNDSTGTPISNDGTASYLQDANGSTNREMFRLANGRIPLGSTVTAIEVRARVGIGSGPSKSVSLSYQRIGTDGSPVDGTAVTLSTSGCCGELITFFWSGLNWTVTQLDSLQIGIRHVSGGQVNCSQIYVIVSYNTPSGPAVTSAVAEISPNKVGTYSTGNSFTYDIYAIIGGGNTGVNRVTVTVPSEFGAPSVSNVLVGGSPVSYTNNTVGNTIDVTLTTKVTTSSNIRILFTSNSPAVSVIRNFTSTVDDNSTPSQGPQATTEGNGDGDPSDANSWSVVTDIKVDGTYKDWTNQEEFRDRNDDASAERTDIRHVYLTGSINGDTLFGRINTDATLTASDSVTLDIFLDTSSDANYDYRLEMVVKTSGNTKNLYKNNPVDTLLSNDSLVSHTGSLATGVDTMPPGQGGANQATEFSIPFSNIGNPTSALFLFFTTFVGGPGSAEDDRYPDKGLIKHDPIDNKQSKADIMVNEVFYKPVTGEEWVELYNAYPSGLNLNGWQVTDEDGTSGNNQANLPNWTVPTKNYLVIHLGSGTNDSNFADTVGHYYSQNTGAVLDDEDQVSLYDNATRSSSTLRDFTAWDDDTARSSDAASDDINAVIAAQWFDNEALVAQKPIPDQSIGRDSLSSDLDSLSNWDKHGGVHARGPTNGSKNKGGNANTLIRNILRNLSTGDITLTWESISGVIYDLLYADSLTGSFSDIADVSSGGGKIHQHRWEIQGHPSGFCDESGQYPLCSLYH